MRPAYDPFPRHGITPLQIACGFGSPRVAQQLINAGAELLPIRWLKIVEKPAVVQVMCLSPSAPTSRPFMLTGSPQRRRWARGPWKV